MRDALLRSRFTRFALVGGAATALQYALLILFVEIAGIDKVPASALSFTLSALANYLLNYRFTFASNRDHAQTLPRFALVAMLGLAVNTASFSALVGVFHYLIAQVGATLITLAGNFLLHQFWIYRSPQ